MILSISLKNHLANSVSIHDKSSLPNKAIRKLFQSGKVLPEFTKTLQLESD